MKLIEWKNSKSWDSFVAGQKQAQFLESWGWGDSQEKEGRKVYKLAMMENSEDEAKGVLFLIRHRLAGKYGYFYTPRGPILSDGYNRMECWKKMLDKIKNLAKKENAVFWRFEPVLPLPEKINLNLHKAAPVQPKNTLILDLEPSEEDLLKKMHPKTRYNIKVAQKKGIKISKVENIEKGIDAFWELLNTTAKRQEFILHNYDHYLNIAKSKLGQKLFFASYNGRNIAANLNMNFGDTSVYLHGASSDEFRNLKPTSLLQWEAIKEAKKEGFHYYDFWGINKTNNQIPGNSSLQKGDYRKDWEGITRFKTGFGGREINFPGAYEFPLNEALYNLYRLYKKVKSSLLN